ncbi:MAG TPA: PLD nuclease N-terminal domain-containing protein [Streptosporangiaceae bacterium]|nr:PLD nuclease N-terminal domain-containing protein [Streptosporangiaceae bacterium]
MLLLAALFGLLATGVWLYCLVDIVLTSRSGCRHLTKAAWLAVVTLAFVVGAVAWLLLGRSGAGLSRLAKSQPRRRDRPRMGYAAPRSALAKSRHPAGRARPIGPDDDPGFLLELDHLIRGGRDGGNDM